MKKTVVASVFLFVSGALTAHAATREEIVEQIRQGEAAQQAEDNERPDKTDQKAATAYFIRILHSSSQWMDKLAVLSKALYKEVLKTETDDVALKVMLTAKYQGHKLTPFSDIFPGLSDTEMLQMTKLILSKGPHSRFVFSENEDAKGLEKIGEAFVRQGFTNGSLSRFLLAWDRVAKEVRSPKYGVAWSQSLERVISGMLWTAAKNPALEKQILNGLIASFEKLSTPAKTSLIVAISGNRSLKAYRFIRDQFKSPSPEVRKTALQSWYRLRPIEATNDMIRLVKGIEAGTVNLNEDPEVLKKEISSIIYNKVLGDLDRVTRNYYGVLHEEDYLAVKKMRMLVFEMLNSQVPFLKTNFQTFLKSRAFTDAEIEARLMAIATDPLPSNHWTAPQLVQNRILTSDVAIHAMNLLVNHPDEDTAKTAQRNLRDMQKWRGYARYCGAIF